MPDLTPLPEDWERALCVVAHPDDLEYGVSSAVARWTDQGKTVTYLLATRGEAGIDAMPPSVAGPLREAEERAGAREVGVDVVEFLGFTDGVIEQGLPLRREITRGIRQHKPDVVVTVNFDLSFGGLSFNMADHRAVGLATVDACRDAGNRWIFPELIGAGLDPWNGVRMACIGASLHPTHGVDVTGFLARGIASLRAHEVYLANLGDGFDPATFLTETAAAAGAQLGVEHAITFQVYEI